MTAEQVEVSLGRPQAVNRSGSEQGVEEQWVYQDYKPRYVVYLYFDNAVLRGWQEVQEDR
jgi:hypothetical protein